MIALKVTTVGSATGVVLTKEVQARLNIKEGDMIYLTDMPDGGYKITAHDPEFDQQMDTARQIMQSDRDILSELVK